MNHRNTFTIVLLFIGSAPFLACGSDDSAPRSGVNESKKLNEISGPDERAICETWASSWYGEKERNKEYFCRETGHDSTWGASNNAEAAEFCRQAYDECMRYEDERSTDGCRNFLGDYRLCDATVGQLETCLADDTATWIAWYRTIPSCDEALPGADALPDYPGAIPSCRTLEEVCGISEGDE